MNFVKMKARAKINLSLDVINKRPDGYHNVKMIMQTVELHDEIFIEETAHDIEIICDKEGVPSDNTNIAYKAADLFIDRYALKGGVRIKIIKNIPVAAGLAGGSSNAAAVLKGMSRLFSIETSDEELMYIGKKIGADVPYCIKGGTMLAEGIGEVLTPLPSFVDVHIVLVKPKIQVSTPWVYNNLNLQKIYSKPDTDLLLDAISNRRIDVLAKNMKNVLESVTEQEYCEIREIKEKLIESGALGSLMSGSGSAVFGIFGDYASAESAFNSIKSREWDCFLTYTI